MIAQRLVRLGIRCGDASCKATINLVIDSTIALGVTQLRRSLLSHGWALTVPEPDRVPDLARAEPRCARHVGTVWRPQRKHDGGGHPTLRLALLCGGVDCGAALVVQLDDRDGLSYRSFRNAQRDPGWSDIEVWPDGDRARPVYVAICPACDRAVIAALFAHIGSQSSPTP